jgi:hypothetical protein
MLAGFCDTFKMPTPRLLRQPLASATLDGRVATVTIAHRRRVKRHAPVCDADTQQQPRQRRPADPEWRSPSRRRVKYSKMREGHARQQRRAAVPPRPSASPGERCMRSPTRAGARWRSEHESSTARSNPTQTGAPRTSLPPGPTASPQDCRFLGQSNRSAVRESKQMPRNSANRSPNPIETGRQVEEVAVE